LNQNAGKVQYQQRPNGNRNLNGRTMLPILGQRAVTSNEKVDTLGTLSQSFRKVGSSEYLLGFAEPCTPGKENIVLDPSCKTII